MTSNRGIVQRTPLHYKAMTRAFVTRGVKYRLFDKTGKMIEQGEFISDIETVYNRARVHVIVDGGPKRTQFLDEMGIVPRHTGRWRPNRFTLPRG